MSSLVHGIITFPNAICPQRAKIFLVGTTAPDAILRLDARDYNFGEGAEVTSIVETGTHNYTFVGDNDPVTPPVTIFGPYFHSSAPKHFQFTDMIPSLGNPFTSTSQLTGPVPTNADLSLIPPWTIIFCTNVPAGPLDNSPGHIFTRYSLDVDNGGWELYKKESFGFPDNYYWQFYQTDGNLIELQVDGFDGTAAANKGVYETFSINNDGTNINFYLNQVLTMSYVIADEVSSPGSPATSLTNCFSNFSWWQQNFLYAHVGFFAIYDSYLSDSIRNAVESDCMSYFAGVGSGGFGADTYTGIVVEPTAGSNQGSFDYLAETSGTLQFRAQLESVDTGVVGGSITVSIDVP